MGSSELVHIVNLAVRRAPVVERGAIPTGQPCLDVNRRRTGRGLQDHLGRIFRRRRRRNVNPSRMLAAAASDGEQREPAQQRQMEARTGLNAAAHYSTAEQSTRSMALWIRRGQLA